MSSAITVITVATVINLSHNEGKRGKSIDSEIASKVKLSSKSICFQLSTLMESKMALSFRNIMVHNSVSEKEHQKLLEAIGTSHRD